MRGFDPRLVRVSPTFYTMGNYTATKFTKAEGAGFTGWIVAHVSDRYDVSDPIPTKHEALKLLRQLSVRSTRPSYVFGDRPRSRR